MEVLCDSNQTRWQTLDTFKQFQTDNIEICYVIYGRSLTPFVVDTAVKF